MNILHKKANFVKHEPCPKCGSRDNLARYSDGSAWCFGCGRYEAPPNNLENMRNRLMKVAKVGADCEPINLVARELPDKAYNWLKKYGLTGYEIEPFLWTEQHGGRLIWPVYAHDEETLIFWQGRSFDKHRPKYLSSGKLVEEQVFGYGKTPTCHLVEDVVSAIKLGRHATTVCLFGSNVGVNRLESLCRRFGRLALCLDPDKTAEAFLAASRAKSIGLDVRAYAMPADPKELSDSQLQSICELVPTDVSEC